MKYHHDVSLVRGNLFVCNQKTYINIRLPIRKAYSVVNDVLSNSAVVFIAHGAGEHSGRYEHSGLGQFLMDHRYAVYCHDHGWCL